LTKTKEKTEKYFPIKIPQKPMFPGDFVHLPASEENALEPDALPLFNNIVLNYREPHKGISDESAP